MFNASIYSFIVKLKLKHSFTQLFLNSYQQLRIAKAGEIGNVRIVDTAIEPVQPIKPKKLLVLILSVFVGGFIGTLIALLRNMLRTGIKDSGQIENGGFTSLCNCTSFSNSRKPYQDFKEEEEYSYSCG